MVTQKDILAIFAKHTTWQDEGDRRTVAEFLNRDPDAPDTFGPLNDETDQNDENRDNDENDENDTDTPKTPNAAKPVKASPATVRK